MKKLMIAACVAVVAHVANAETWTVINAGAYDGYTIVGYVLGAKLDDYDNVALSSLDKYFLGDSALAKTKSETWAQHYALVSEMFPSSTVENGTASGDSPVIPLPLTAVFMLCPDGIAPGKEYILTKTLYDASENSTFDFTNVQTLASGKFRTDSVPEPTSGLLMLIGMAGLALKRKRA